MLDDADDDDDDEVDDVVLLLRMPFAALVLFEVLLL